MIEFEPIEFQPVSDNNIAFEPIAFEPIKEEKKRGIGEIAFEPLKKAAELTQKALSPKTADVLGNVVLGIPFSEAAKNVKEVIDAPVPTLVKRLTEQRDPVELARTFAMGGIFSKQPQFKPLPTPSVPKPAVGPKVAGGETAGLPGTPVSKPTFKGTAETVVPEATAPQVDPVQKVIQALKEAKPLRKEQESIYSEERSKRLKKYESVRVKGEKGARLRMSKLHGEIQKVQFESLRKAIPQDYADRLFDMINESTVLSGYEKPKAVTGLAKLFGEYGGVVPQNSELALLNKLFGKEFTKAVMDKRDIFKKARDVGYEIVNVPRAVMASGDLSAPGRQGAFFVGKKQYWLSFKDMFRAYGSERAYKSINASIMKKPSYPLMKESGLNFSELDSSLALREEKFMSNYSEKIPIIGTGVRASSRAYSGFLNKLRADVFDDLVNKAQKVGLNPYKDMNLSKQIAGFVNAGTGRGSLGALERAAVPLNAFFFSPRLMASRLTLLNPLYYAKLHPFVRKEALKSLFGFAGAWGTIAGIGVAAGAKVGTDPRSADFLKLKIGNTRLDFGGGFQQYLKLAAQLATGKLVSSSTGKVMSLGEGYKPLTRLDILYRFAEAKEAPVFSFATGLLKGQTAIGEKFSVPKEIGQRFIPMVIGDVVDLYKDDPSMLPLSALGVFGVSLQTYGDKKKREK